MDQLHLSPLRPVSRRRFLQHTAIVSMAASMPFKMSLPSTGYWAYAQDRTQAPAVLLIHDWHGLDAGLHHVAQQFIAAGYTVYAPDFFKGRVLNEPAQASRVIAQISPDSFVLQMRDALHQMSAQDFVDARRIAVVSDSNGAGVVLDTLRRYSSPNVGMVVPFTLDSSNTLNFLDLIPSMPGRAHLFIGGGSDHIPAERREAYHDATWTSAIAWLNRNLGV
jgi:dienelactone hydrolase